MAPEVELATKVFFLMGLNVFLKRPTFTRDTNALIAALKANVLIACEIASKALTIPPSPANYPPASIT